MNKSVNCQNTIMRWSPITDLLAVANVNGEIIKLQKKPLKLETAKRFVLGDHRITVILFGSWGFSISRYKCAVCASSH